jgi:MFS family permease
VSERGGRLKAVASLRDSPRFRLLWASNLFFFGGAWMQTLVLGWVVYDTTHSEFQLAVFTAARLAPMLLGPLAGVMSDRHDRVRLLMIACGWGLSAVMVVAAMTSLGIVPYWALVLSGLAIGMAHSPSQPARMSLVLDLVGRDNLSNANALNSMAMNMTQVFGPAAGGALLSTVGAPAALWISAGWYAASLALLWPLRRTARTAPPVPEPVLRMLSGGIRSIVTNRLASAVLLITLAANVFLWPIYQGFMPVFAKSNLGLDAAGLGWLLTFSGIGGLIGSVVIAAMGDFRFKGGVFLVGTAIWATLWSLFALSHLVVTSFALMAAIGVMSSAFAVLQTTLLLMTTDPAIQGRALGVQELAIGVMPVSSLALGAAAQTIGVGPTTFLSGLCLIAILVGITVWVPKLLTYGSPAPVAP